jgi:hypothetical protein
LNYFTEPLLNISRDSEIVKEISFELNIAADTVLEVMQKAIENNKFLSRHKKQ